MAVTLKQAKIMVIIFAIVAVIVTVIGWIFRDKLKNLFHRSGSLTTSLTRSNRSGRADNSTENVSARPGRSPNSDGQDHNIMKRFTDMFSTTSSSGQSKNSNNDESSANQPSSLTEEKQNPLSSADTAGANHD